MSKKYIYFKKVSHFSGNFSCKSLSLLEASSFIEGLEVIQNVFQLLQYDDLKLLISKNGALQNLLTANLPQDGRHGYLWQGENLPDTLNLLQKSAGISTCVVFQRNSDPPPKILKTPFSRLMQQLEIYNWLIYIFPTYNQIRRYFESKDKDVRTEIDVDRYYRELWREIENGQKNDRVYEIDYPAAISAPKRDWQTMLMNLLSNGNERSLFIPFAEDGSILFEAILGGKPVACPINNILYQKALQEKTIVCHFDPAHYNKAISILISQIRFLQTANFNTQKDLFADDAEQRFSVFWEQERIRYQKQKMKWLSIDLFKFFAIIRFLVEQQLISRDEQINNFVFSVLLLWADRVVKKKKVADPVSDFLNFIRKQYLDYYILSKIKELAPAYPAQPVDYFSSQTDSAPTLMGGAFLNMGNKSRLLNEENKLLNIFYPDMNTMSDSNEKLSPTLDDDAANKWISMINLREEKYLLLGGYGQGIINRLMASVQQKEAAISLMRWVTAVDRLNNYRKLLAAGCKIALILEPFYIKNQSEPEEIKIQNVIAEMLSNHEELNQYKIKHDLEIKYTDALKRVNRKIILLLEED